MKLISGAGGGGSSTQPQSTTNPSPNLHDVALAHITDLVSEGEIQGFKHGVSGALQDIYLNGTPIANSDGSLNFSNILVDSRTGTQDQSYIAGTSDISNEINVGVELKSTAPWTQVINDITLSALRVRLSVPALENQNSSTGAITGYTIAYTIEVSTDGGAFQTVVSSAFSGLASDEYDRAHRFDLPPALTGWTVRVTRTTPNANSATTADTTNIASYTEIVEAKLKYPNSALVDITIDASQFSSIPTRGFHLLGRIISVPSNYSPTTRVYTGTWDGTFKPAYSNNPAWVYYDMLTNNRYGLGTVIDPSMINKWALYSIAQYCDELVPTNDGAGGMEPRFTCNLYLQAQDDALKVMQDLASVFRGIVYWAAGAVQTNADMPSDPVYTYTNANVIGGKFTYSGASKTARFTTALVSWNNMDNMGQAEVVYVPDRDGIARYGIRPTQIIAVGCTSRSQAVRVGLWALYTSRLETETVQFQLGLDATIAAPGSIVNIADAPRAGSRQAGRIKTVLSAKSIIVDKAPTAAAGDSLTVVLPSGVSEKQTIQSVSGSTITTAANFSITPEKEAVWLVETATLAAQSVRILAIKEDTANTDDTISYTVTALKHNASKFDAIDFGAPLTIPPTSIIPPSTQAGPTNVQVTQTDTAYTVTASTVLHVTWAAAPNAIYYILQWCKDNGHWNTAQPTGLGYNITVDPGVYQIRVSAVNAAGVTSLPTLADDFTVQAQTMLPTTLADIQTNAANALTQAQNAQDSADAANAQLASISNDNLLTPGEKQSVIIDYSNITSEQPGIDAQATAYAITTEKTAYDSAVSALTSYLATLTAPTAWNDKSGNTTIVGTTFRSNFEAVYTARQTLLNEIYNLAKLIADEAQDSANVSLSGFVSETVDNSTFSMPLDSQGNIPGWVGYQGNHLSLISSAYWNNANVLKIDGPATGAVTTRKYPCKPGDYVSALADLFKSGGTSNAMIRVQFLDVNNAFINSPLIQSFGTALNTWQTINAKGPAPVNSAFFELMIYNPDPSTGYVLANNVRVSINDLRTEGSGAQIGNQLNLLPLNWMGVRSLLNTTPISYSFDTANPANITFSCAAVTVTGGSAVVSYNASGTTGSQARGTTATWYFYYIDAKGAGGSQTLHATTNPQDRASSDGVVNLGSGSITVPASGGGSGSGAGGGGGFCVCSNMLINEDMLAGEAQPGQLFDCISWPKSRGKVFKRRLRSVERIYAECVRLTTNAGAVLECGVTTPFDLLDGGIEHAPHMKGHKVFTDQGIETVVLVEYIGVREVCYFHFGGICYAAGADPFHRIYSHNTTQPIEKP